MRFVLNTPRVKYFVTEPDYLDSEYAMLPFALVIGDCAYKVDFMIFQSMPSLERINEILSCKEAFKIFLIDGEFDIEIIPDIDEDKKKIKIDRNGIDLQVQISKKEVEEFVTDYWRLVELCRRGLMKAESVKEVKNVAATKVSLVEEFSVIKENKNSASADVLEINRYFLALGDYGFPISLMINVYTQEFEKLKLQDMSKGFLLQSPDNTQELRIKPSTDSNLYNVFLKFSLEEGDVFECTIQKDALTGLYSDFKYLLSKK